MPLSLLPLFSLLLLLVAALSPQCVGRLVRIDNDASRRDVNGTIMDIHDGNILLHNNTYYYYGNSYGNCTEPTGPDGCAGMQWGSSCGFRLNHNVSLYTSPDLATWTAAPEHVFEIARDFPVPAVMWAPKVLYNPSTQLWVMWVNYMPSDGVNQYAVATSSSPFGPFTVVVKRVTTLVNASPTDGALWQDPVTHQAYFAYSGQYVVSVEALTPDYLSTLGAVNSSGAIGPYAVEAPAFFRHRGVYYVSFGPLCCYCQPGAAAVMYTSANPLGPYDASTTFSAAAMSQQTDITRFIDADGDERFLYRGNRWQQSPDGTKGHDPTYVGLLEFIEGEVQPLIYRSHFNISVLQVDGHALSAES